MVTETEAKKRIKRWNGLYKETVHTRPSGFQFHRVELIHHELVPTPGSQFSDVKYTPMDSFCFVPAYLKKKNRMKLPGLIRLDNDLPLQR